MSMSSSAFYALSAVAGDGCFVEMKNFRGKVVYAVNVASH
jgi:glutathione peroxidase-family protein